VRHIPEEDLNDPIFDGMEDDAADRYERDIWDRSER
jgi:hypothetical protein